MAKHKVIITFTTIGIILALLINYLIDKGVRHSNLEQTGKVNKISEHSIDPQLMIFGSSVSEVGISSSILSQNTGLTVYNASMNGTRYMQYKGLIKEFNNYSKNNKYIVLVETYFSFEKIDAIAYADRYLARLNNDNLYKDLYDMQPSLIWKCKYIPFYKYVAASKEYYKNAYIGWQNMFSSHLKADTQLGYFPVDRDWEADADEAIKNTKAFKIKVDENIVNEYIQSINNIQKSGKKVIIVLTPMYFKILNTITDFTPMKKTLLAISSSTGATFLDFSNSEICDNKSLFYNTNHLNKRGSIIFSNLLSDSLKTIVK